MLKKPETKNWKAKGSRLKFMKRSIFSISRNRLDGDPGPSNSSSKKYNPGGFYPKFMFWNDFFKFNDIG
jgi:hypothetical protein